MMHPAFGQFRENTTPELACGTWRGQPGTGHFCEVREVRLPVAQRLDIQAGPNGGVTVKGWNRPEILVRARIDATSKEGEAAAKTLVSQVTLGTSAGKISTTGPDSRNMRNQAWWGASFEIFAPHRLDLTAESVNGGVNLMDLEGAVQAKTVNGGLRLARMAGDVRGKTVNGGLHVELEGDRWRGTGLDLTTTNGGVNLSLPAAYSADFRASTVHGGVSADFPLPARKQNAGLRQDVELVLGNGGPTVQVRTTNGGVKLKRLP